MSTRTVDYRCREGCGETHSQSIPRSQTAPDRLPCPGCKLDARRVWGTPHVRPVPGFYSYSAPRSR